MKISQSDAFFNALSSRQVKMRLYRVKMMTYNEISIIFENFDFFFFFDFSFFVPMGQEMLNLKFHGVSGPKVINLHVPEEIEFKSKRSEPGAGNQYQR